MAALEGLALMAMGSAAVERLLEVAVAPLVDLVISPEPIEGNNGREQTRKRARLAIFSIAGMAFGNLLSWGFRFGAFGALGATEAISGVDFIVTGVLLALGSQGWHKLFGMTGNGK